MPITAKAQGKTFTFPDGTSPEQMGAAIDEFFANQQTGGADVGGNGALGLDTPSVNAGVEQDSQVGIQDIEQAFLDIPGMPSLTEFASGFNRSAAGFVDFLGPDNINAVLELAGSEKRVPTLTQAITAERGAFDQGLTGEAAGVAGELSATALGVGQGLRSLAQRLPAFTAGEGVGRGLTRQLGQSTAGQDIVAGAAAGAGQELGRELAGEDGALVGGLVAPLAVAIPISTAKQQAGRLLKQSAPSTETLKETARGIYKSLDDSGISVSDAKFNTLADDIANTLRKEGSDIDLTPKANAVINRLQTEKGAAKTLTELDTLRKVAKNAADSPDRAEARLGTLAVNKIDDFLDDIGDEVIGGKEAGQAFRSARDLWQRARKSETLEQALINAENQASGFENGIRTQFRQILKRIDSGKLKGFTAEEREAIKKTVQGTNAGNLARFLGKFGVLDGVTSRSLTTIGGAGLAGAAGGAGAAAAVPLVGQVSSALAQRMTQNNARMAQNIIRAGKNANLITNIYMRNTPAKQRSANELAELFLTNRVPLDNVSLRKARPIMSDAAIIASIAKLNDQKEGAQ